MDRDGVMLKERKREREKVGKRESWKVGRIEGCGNYLLIGMAIFPIV